MVSRMRHAAALQFDEEGVEASAATTSRAYWGSRGDTPECFRADRPFLIALVDRSSQLVLFLGRIVR
jgi:serine protease inhibitor